MQNEPVMTRAPKIGTGPVRVAVADSDPRICRALDMVLRCESEFTLAGESRDYGTLLTLVQSTRPDLIVFDWDLPGRPAKAPLADLRLLAPQIKIIVLGRRAESKHIALSAGADTFVSKVDSPDQLLAALQAFVKRDPGDLHSPEAFS